MGTDHVYSVPIPLCPPKNRGLSRMALVFRFIKIFTILRNIKVEFLPAIHDRA